MSNVAVVHRYEAAAALSDDFGRALTEVLRVHHEMPGFDALTDIEMARATGAVAQTIFSLERALEAKRVDTPVVESATPAIVEGAATWLQATHQGEAVKATDLHTVRAHIENGPSSLDKHDLDVLERVATVLDAFATHCYSQMSREIRGARS